MNLEELDKFQITKAINFNNDLNPQLFVDEVMRPEVHQSLIGIADHFREFLGVELTSLVDITLSGSNAAYSYTPHSDVDLHLIVDFSQLPDNEVYRELFDSKKYQYNDQHDIKIKGYDVELYVQDAAQPHVSLGNYSVFNNEWNRFPTKQRANVDEEASYFKYNKLKQLAIRALATDNRQYLDDVLDIVKRYRKAGLSENGEFGPENLAFKMLRKDGYFDKLWDKRRSFEDEHLSLEHVNDEVDTDLEQELAADFNNYGESGRTAEDIIKELYSGADTLFDDYDYDSLHEQASDIATMEAAYSGNLGAMEVMKFYKEANQGLIDQFRNLLALRKHKEAWEMIQRFTGVDLVGDEFHEGEMLDEDRAQHVADQLNDKLIARYEEETGNTHTEVTALEIINKLAVASTKAIQWLANRYIAGEYKLEDIGQIKQELMKFAKVKSKLPPEHRDLNRLSLDDLYNVLEPFEEKDTVSNREADRREKKAFLDSSAAELMYKDKDVEIVVPATEEASCFFGKGTKWCTAASYGGDNYFEHYHQQGPLWIIQTKKLGKFQFHFQSNSYMNARDQELTPEEMKELVDTYPQIKKVLNKYATRHGMVPLMDNPSDSELYDAVHTSPWNLKYIDNPSKELQSVVLRDGGLQNIKYIKNPDPEIQLKAIQLGSEVSVGVAFVFNNINNPTDEVKVIAFANEPDLIKDFADIDPGILEKVIKLSKLKLSKYPRPKEFIRPGQATFDVVDDEGEFLTRWNDKGVNEGVGIIVKGVNTTADVDENSTKREAAKLGLTVDKGGIPPLLKSNGSYKTVSNIMEGALFELDMTPGGLRKQVNKIVQTARPVIGLEFEVCVASDDDSNPKVTDETSLRDLQDYFDNSDDDEVWVEMEQEHMEWISAEKEPEWVEDQLKHIINVPYYNDDEKVEAMVNMTTTGDMDDIIIRITGDDDDIELTEEMAKLVISKSQEAYKEIGAVGSWPTPQIGTNPYLSLYYEIFIEDADEAVQPLRELVQADFWESAYPDDSAYSLGSWFIKDTIRSFKEIGREYDGRLYSEHSFFTGDYSNGSFDEEAAHNMASKMEQQLGHTVEVRTVEENEGEPGDDADDLAVASEDWIIMPDSSVKPNDDDDAGMEIIMPPTEYEEGIADVEDIVQFLKQNGGYANESTGLHVNVSMKNIDHSKLDYAKLVLMVGDNKVAREFGREYSEFAVNSLAKLTDFIDSTQGYEKDRPAKAKGYADMMGKMKNNLSHSLMSSFENVDFGKFSSVGIKADRIEFRAAGGADYIHDIEAITHSINRFVVAYAVAADPEAHKKEYAKKLYKMATNLPTHKRANDKTAMTLFAAFNAGMITKDQLIVNLKKAAAKRAEARAAAEAGEAVDTGKPGEVQIPSPKNEREAIEMLADRHAILDMQCEMRWMEAMEIEMGRTGAPKSAARAAFKNLYMDIGHYV